MAFDFDVELLNAVAHFEGRYGPRDKSFDFLPVAFHAEPYAQTLVSERARTIAVRLDQAAKNDDLRLRYQIWHEAVHCLAPTESKETIWFEEGLAVESAGRAPFVNRKYRKGIEARLRGTSWGAPWQAFLNLKATDDQIRAIHERAPGRKFDAVTAPLIIDIFNADKVLADTLCRRMRQDRVT
jgi:hypothetical protein